MGKQQKPKAASAKGIQKTHNKATRGLNTSRKKLDLDFSELELDWVEELAYFIAVENYKVYKESIDDELNEYRVRDSYGNLILSIVSQRDLNKSAFGVKKRRPRRRRQ